MPWLLLNLSWLPCKSSRLYKWIKPSPVPPKLLVGWNCHVCVNLSKWLFFSGAMPIPVSFTLIVSAIVFLSGLHLVAIVTLPSSVILWHCEQDYSTPVKALSIKVPVLSKVLSGSNTSFLPISLLRLSQMFE